MKITDLTKEQVNYWVAKAQGWSIIKDTYDDWHGVEQWNTGIANVMVSDYHPSTNWQQAGELLEKFKISVILTGNQWTAVITPELLSLVELHDPTKGGFQTADTPTRAICLAVIASVYEDY